MPTETHDLFFRLFFSDPTHHTKKGAILTHVFSTFLQGFIKLQGFDRGDECKNIPRLLRERYNNIIQTPFLHVLKTAPRRTMKHNSVYINLNYVIVLQVAELSRILATSYIIILLKGQHTLQESSWRAM